MRDNYLHVCIGLYVISVFYVVGVGIGVSIFKMLVLYKDYRSIFSLYMRSHVCS